MPFDVIVAWQWILAGVLISALGIWLAYKQARTASAYVYLGGLLLLAVSSFRVYPALVRYYLPQDVQQLQDELLEAKRKAAAAEERFTNAKAELMRSEQIASSTESDLKLTQSSQATCIEDKEKTLTSNKTLQSKFEKSAAELDALRNKISIISDNNKTLTAQLDAVRAELQTTLRSYQTQKDLLSANIDHVRLVEAEKSALAIRLAAREQQTADASHAIAKGKAQAPDPKTPVAAAPTEKSPPPNVDGRVQPANPMERAGLVLNGTPNLGIQKLESRELVQGEVGDYYLISLKDAKTGSPIIFPAAQFIISEKGPELRAAMTKLHESVLQRIPVGWRYRIFVRGYADGGSFKEPVGNDNYRSLEFLPPRDAYGSGYLGQTIRKQLGAEFENEDLPNLRGAFLARTLLETMKGEAPMLLGNTPQSGVNTANRRAEIILLVKGPLG